MNENLPSAPPSNRTPEGRPGKLSAIILTAQVSERVFTLVVTAAVAKFFGADRALDIALLALAVPNALGDLLETIAYVSLLPFFSRSRTESGEAEGWSVANGAFNSLGLGLVGLFAVYAALLPLVTRLMTQGYSSEEINTTVTYGWIAAPILLFRGLGGIATSYLMSDNLVWPAFGRLIFRGLARVLLFLLLYRAGWGVAAFVAATTLSDFAAVLFCMPAVNRLRGAAPYRPRRLLPASTLLRMLSDITSQAVIGGVNATILIFERGFASGLAAGSVASINYARGIALLPLMAGRSVSAGLYPKLTREAFTDQRALASTVWRGLRAVVFITLPASLVFLFARTELVSLAYRRGQFTDRNVQDVSLLVAYYLVACIVWAVSFLVSRALFAAMHSALVAKLEALSWLVYIAAAAYLTPRLGVVALPLAFLIRIVVSTGLIMIAVARKDLIRAERPVSYLLATALGAALLFVGAWTGKSIVHLHASTGSGATGLAVLAAFAGAAVFFLPYAYFANRSEMRQFLAFLRPRR